MAPEVIMVHSYKGGCGKTMFSTNLASLLVKTYSKTVLLIESDFSMPSFQSIFTNHNPDIFFNDFLERGEPEIEPFVYTELDGKLSIVFCKEEFKSSDYIHSTDQSWFRKKKELIEKMIEILSYDYVIFDLSPGMSLFAVNTFFVADKIFLIMSADVQSLRGTKYLLSDVYRKIAPIKDRDLYTIINQSPVYEEMDMLLENWIGELQTKFNFLSGVFSINYNSKTAYAAANQTFILPEDDKTLDAISKIIVETVIKEDK